MTKPIQPIAGRSAVAADRETPQQQSKQQRKHNSRSTRTAAQEARILAALRTGSKTTDDLRALGCYQSSARIFGLRKKGYEIATELFDGFAADGYSHARMARYTLLDEPQEVSA